MSSDSTVDERKHPVIPAAEAHTFSPFTLVALVQAVVYIATGIWPFASMRTFLLVTGPKVDLWLVKTVGALVTVIGAVIGLAGIRRQRSPEVALLAIGSAATLTGIDVYYVAKRRISRVYLLDAVGETVLILAWLWALAKPSRQER
ncbi:MAG TPA: hypothetical protein VF707_13095 [Ardenticatenaceae bacterium]|jgi:hypothetical protein